MNNNPIAAQQEMILVVDDDISICNLLQAGIQMAGYRCFVAQSPRLALSLLDQHPVDVVVADIKMPEMNGIELAHIIKARYKADVIIMTGFIEDFNYEDIVMQGASDFLQKPVRIAEFIARLKRVIAERRSRIDLKQALADLKLNLEKLRRAMEGIVEAISVTVEMRDPYTSGHQRRVSEVAVAIGRELGLDEHCIEGLRIAGIIHDIGKISIPAEILSRPGKLSEAEFEIIKVHPQVGYEIVKGVNFPWPVAQAILQHHERLDGSGYPNGLKGEQIILEARILAVADVVEAMSSHRPYRPGLGIDAALAQLHQEVGTKLDADVVAACERLFREKGFRLPD